MKYSWIIAIIVFLVSFYFFDRKNWREKPLGDFHDMVRNDDDYVGWKLGLTELRKRGADIEPYLEMMINRLTEPERIVREQAKLTTASNYPNVKPALKGINCVNELDDAVKLAAKIKQEHCS